MAKISEEEKKKRLYAASVRNNKMRAAVKKSATSKKSPTMKVRYTNKDGVTEIVEVPNKSSFSFCSWVIPLVGDPIRVGPFKSPYVTFATRYRIVRKLAQQNNARPLDIQLLGMFDAGELFVDR